MAAITLTTNPFPVGATVGAYTNAKETARYGLKPLAAATATGVVGADGELTITVAAGNYSLAAPSGGLFQTGLVFTPKTGQTITVALVDPAGTSQNAAIDVTGNVITIDLATDGDDAISSTLSEIVAYINGTAAAFALVTASLDNAVDGATLVTAEASSFNAADPKWVYMDGVSVA